MREKFVLKGAVLLAAFGNRRPTRDWAGHQQRRGDDSCHDPIRTLCSISEDDGIEFALDTATSELIRDEDEYSGVRVNLDANIATSRNRFHVDVNVGDPIVPSPTIVSVPRLMGGDPITIKGYPLHMVHAEKIVTAVQRGVANTRWRDFGDIWALSRSRCRHMPPLRTTPLSRPPVAS